MHASINTYLKQWGLNPNGKPLVQLVRAGDQRELRRGDFNVFCGEIFIREERGVREMPKYPYLPPNVWVLERWFHPAVTFSAELPDSVNGSYEPIYVFQDAHGGQLPLSLKVVELICSAMFNRPPDKSTIRQGIAKDLEVKEKASDERIAEATEMSSPIGSLLSTGEALAYGPHKGGQ